MESHPCPPRPTIYPLEKVVNKDEVVKELRIDIQPIYKRSERAWVWRASAVEDLP